jgi:hypothetical protein
MKYPKELALKMNPIDLKLSYLKGHPVLKSLNYFIKIRYWKNH